MNIKILVLSALMFIDGWLWAGLLGNSFTIKVDGGMEAIATLVAAFAGAGAAFLLQARRDFVRRREAEVQAILQTQFGLLAQYKKLKTVFDSSIEQHKGNAAAWIEMRPAQHMSSEHHRVDIAQVHFLLKENPSDLLKVHGAQESFLSALQAINMRSDIHMREVQPAISEIQRSGVNLSSVEDLEAHLDQRLFALLKSATDATFTAFEVGMDNTTYAINMLYEIGTENYPNEKFIRMPA